MPAKSKLHKNDQTTPIVPFLKWAGGKRWFVSSHASLLPMAFNTYIEPFLGAGSVYFHLMPRRAILSDANAALVETYKAIKRDWKALERSLKYRNRRHREDDDDYYYWLRE